MIKYFSAFSGVGGLEKSIQDIFPDAECVGFSEINPYAIKVYEKHFPNHKNYGDITKIDINSLSDFDLFVGGFPCTDMSIAKMGRMGLEGDQSKLFYNAVEIIKIKKPKWIIIENVNSMSKENKYKISKILGEAIGYTNCLIPNYIEPIMIDAAKVSAQTRKRLFWCNFFVNQPKDRKIFLKDILENNANTDKLKSYCIDASYAKGASLEQYENKSRRQLVFNGNGIEKQKSNTIRSSGRSSGINDKHNWDTIRIGEIGNGGQANRIYSVEGKSVTLSAGGGGRGAMTGLYLIKSAASRGRNLIDGKRKDILGAKTQQRIEIGGDKSNTLTSVSKDSLVAINDYVRKLSVIEVARLQCFPDSWCDGISDSQAYRCYGNAVNVEVVKHIMECLKKHIKSLEIL